MARLLLLALPILMSGDAIHAMIKQSSYWQLRRQLLMDEKRQSLGGDLELGPVETKANQVLMAAKDLEIYNGFHNDSFLPARNFMEVIPEIEKSQVFKILRDLPKGGILHCHDTAIVSHDYKLHNITYRDNLYICDENGTLHARFFDAPDDKCDWRLLSDLRQDPKQADAINDRIAKEMTMITQNPRNAYDTVDKAWKKFNRIFSFITPMLTYKPVYEDQFYQALQEFYDDNVMYVEVRTTLATLYDLDGKTYSPLETVQIHKDIAERFTNDHPDFIGVKLIYAPSRAVDVEQVDNYLEIMAQLRKRYPNFVVGFDLVGQEDKGQPLIAFADKLNSVDPQIQFFFHAGETNWNGWSTDMNILDAFLLNTRRIGHGYALTKHPLLWDLVKHLGIAVEVCPISNQVLGLVNDMRNHPAANLFASGSPMVISNDDPALWGAKGLSYDFYEAFMGIMSAGSDLRSLKKLALNSFAYSSMNRSEKQNAITRWHAKWDVFVTKLAGLSS
ncbi:adenosine deaminase 2 [Harpegnathos saltator]|uniref:Adenosine deaminase n=1 Tax=Harpegnathos saltator TaxID=610380 RepID=E2BFN2_HARSA|nr:adenosine deaminase 2 [Harpegnathos saltator]EFN85554.1 Cat eye syndrome critical region protein 1 [Harpegnathos saltator]